MKPISLSKARKDRSRQKAKEIADANAIRFGRTKAEKTRDVAKVQKADRDLDGHKRDR